MKPILPPVFLCAALALAGCSANQATQIASNINTVNAALTSPAANQALHNIKSGSQALLCVVADVSAVSNVLTQQVKAGEAAIKDTQDVYVVSGTICQMLGGAVVSTVTVPATVQTQ